MSRQFRRQQRKATTKALAARPYAGDGLAPHADLTKSEAALIARECGFVLHVQAIAGTFGRAWDMNYTEPTQMSRGAA